MVVYTARLPGDLLLLVHQEDERGDGIPLPSDERPLGRHEKERPRRILGPFAGESRSPYGNGWTGGWTSLEQAAQAIRIQGWLNNRDRDGRRRFD